MKSNKKSMILTTVIMVVLLVAAITTATFAWFTAADTVNLGASTIVAAKTDAASLGIGPSKHIASNNLSFMGMPTEMDGLTTIEGVLPMIPTLAQTGASRLTTFDMMTANIDGSLNFIGAAPISYDTSRHPRFIATFNERTNTAVEFEQDTNPEIVKTSNAIYIAVGSMPQAATVTVNISGITVAVGSGSVQVGDVAQNEAALRNAARIAVFASVCTVNPVGSDAYLMSTTVDAEAVHVGTWSFAGGTNVTHGTPVDGEPAAELVTRYLSLSQGTNANAPVIDTSGAPGFVRFVVVAWFDGPAQVEHHADMELSFLINFGLLG